MIMTGLARLGRDAELRFTGNSEPVATLALAFNYGQKTGDGNKPTQWIEAALWGKRAESLAQHLKKGTAIAVIISEPHIETYEKRDGGGQGFKLVGRVLELEFAGSRSEGQPSGASSSAPSSSAPRQQRPAQPAARPSFDDLGQDIPF